MAREQWVQRSPEWFAARRDLLTASDAASALDIKPYASYRGSPRAELLRKKATNAPLSNMFVVHGQKYEDEARALACGALGETVADVGLVRHASLPWLGASPDGVTMSGKLVEIKCPLKREIVPGHVPGHYYPQIQVQMEVCDVDATIFVQYKPGTLTADGLPVLDVVVVERDKEWFRRHRDALHAFWREFMGAKQSGDASVDAPAPADHNSVSCAVAPNPYW
jgi:putative phage-type endonuclease